MVCWEVFRNCYEKSDRNSVGTVCEDKGTISPLYCEKVKNEKCPVELPCESHDSGIEGRVGHGVSLLTAAIGDADMSHISIVIPCDSTDAWVVAAYDDIDDSDDISYNYAVT